MRTGKRDLRRGRKQPLRDDEILSGEPAVHSRSIPSELSDTDLEGAIVAAMLDGRRVVAEVLAERLKERRHERAGVVELQRRPSPLRRKAR
jgi:hypothetical protein